MDDNERQQASLGTWVKRILIGAALLAALSRAVNGTPEQKWAERPDNAPGVLTFAAQVAELSATSTAEAKQ